MSAYGVSQSNLYNNGYGQLPNQFRDRSNEQTNGGSKTMIPQFNYAYDPTQSSGLGRYIPPTLSNPMTGADQWNNQGGYSYNLPNSFGALHGNNGMGAMGFGIPQGIPQLAGAPQTGQVAPSAINNPINNRQGPGMIGNRTSPMLSQLAQLYAAQGGQPPATNGIYSQTVNAANAVGNVAAPPQMSPFMPQFNNAGTAAPPQNTMPYQLHF